MFSTRFIAAAAASLSLMSSVTADYNPLSQANVALYYGQGPNQQNLRHFCDSSSVDIIPIGFINIFPNFANGLVAQNFGNQCWDGNYTGPGYNGVNNPKNNFLYERCPQLQEDIYYCQTKTKKKILLSLGGDGGNYQLNGANDGKLLAEFLWGAYGPYDAAWVAKGGVRPLDRGELNTDLTKKIDIDGFDFDIERASPDNQVGYIACINRLRELFAAYKTKNKCSKTYLISGAPQCPLPEGNMGLTIKGAKFDLLFIQFYNNPSCSGRNWVRNGAKGGFNYNAWLSTLAAGASKDAKIYLGLPGAIPAAAASASDDYLNSIDLKKLIDDWHGAKQFGGVMIWEATYAENNKIPSQNNINYYQMAKKFLNTYAPATTAPATVCSTTVSSTSTSKSSTSTKISTTSSTVKSSSSSTSKSASSTQASTSSVRSSSSSSRSSTVTPTSSSSSVRSSSSSVQSSSSPIKSSSSSSQSTSASVQASSSSVQSSSSTVQTSSSSSAVVSSSSSSSQAISTSSSLSTTRTAAGEFTTSSGPSSTSSTAPGPTAATCAYKGCFTEATEGRALAGAFKEDLVGMTIESCAEFCSGWTYYGLEYTQECYCGNELRTGSILSTEGECNLPCKGDASQTCGGNARLNVYECGAAQATTSASSSASTSSALSSSTSESSSSSSESLTIQTSSAPSSSLTIQTSSAPSSSLTIQTSTSLSSSSSSSETYAEPSFSHTFSYSATTSSSASEMTPTYTDTFSYSATESSSGSMITPTYTDTFTYDPTSSSSMMTATYTDTFTYSQTQSSSSSMETATYTDTFSYSATVSQSQSSSSASETSSSSEYVTSSSSSYSESQSSSSSYETSKTESGPVTPTHGPSSSSSQSGYISSTTCTDSTKGSHSTGASSSVATYAPSSKSSGGEVSYSSKPTSASTTQYTTSTVCTTRVETVTACPPSVTNCPVGSVTTKTIPLYTTVCPVSEKSTKTPIGHPTTTPVPTHKPTGSVTKYTTSTVYTTSVYTVTSCAPSVTDCPSKLGHLTTEIIKLYTTVCPVAEHETGTPVAPVKPSTYAPGVETPAFTGVAIPVPSYPAGGEHAYSYDTSTTTLSSTTTQYKTKTLEIVMSTATIIPLAPTTLSPAPAPYPTGPPKGGYPVGGYPVGGTAAPSAAAQTTTSPEGSEGTNSPVPVYVTGAASRSGNAIGVVVAAFVAVAMVL